MMNRVVRLKYCPYIIRGPLTIRYLFLSYKIPSTASVLLKSLALSDTVVGQRSINSYPFSVILSLCTTCGTSEKGMNKTKKI